MMKEQTWSIYVSLEKFVGHHVPHINSSNVFLSQTLARGSIKRAIVDDSASNHQWWYCQDRHAESDGLCWHNSPNCRACTLSRRRM